MSDVYLSSWAITAKAQLRQSGLETLAEHGFSAYTSQIICKEDSVWIRIRCPKGNIFSARPVYAAGSELSLEKIIKRREQTILYLRSDLGQYRIQYFILKTGEQPVIRFITTFELKAAMLMPFSPRDLLIMSADGDTNTKGTVQVTQKGTRTGLQYVTIDEPEEGAFLYFQNLTALNNYADVTGTSMSDVVGGQWPEIGFSLPPTKDKPLPAPGKYVLSDAFIAFDPLYPQDDAARAKQFMDLLAAVYIFLPKPETAAHDWLAITEKGLQALLFDHGCWSHAAGKDYLNAYVADYKTPPESMVQLAVLLPLMDYYDWSKADLPAIDKIREGLDDFYDPDLKTIVRFLPAMAGDLDGSEEQLKPNVMDAWYLHHPMLNLARMASRGDKQCRRLFLDSLDYVVKVARHFNYEWPVFYDMKTLALIKAETSPGQGGEKDVAGSYAQIMLHAWELTGKAVYLTEAKKAAKTLNNKGFELFYQANNTAFSANAMIWLYKITNEQNYLDLAYVCLANLFRNMQLWDCSYGYAKSYATFFAAFPLNDAPYTAAYEEQEVAAAFHRFLLSSDGIELLPSVSLLMAEFLKYVVNRVAYYYPPNLPAEMLAEKVKTGQLDRNLWIAIEDLHDGWEASGAVGQEVYGAGVAFGIVPRHFYRLPGEDFLLFVEYPSVRFKCDKGCVARFMVQGVPDLSCIVSIIRNGVKKLPEFIVTVEGELLKAENNKVGNLIYRVPGGKQVEVKW